MPLVQSEFLSVDAGRLTVTLPYSGSDTSRQAALRVASRSGQDETRLLAWIASKGSHGATDEEIQRHFGWSGDYERPRRWSLSNKRRLIVASGKRTNEAGNFMTVWVVPTA